MLLVLIQSVSNDTILQARVRISVSYIGDMAKITDER
jgi:hypothetical protein